MKTMNGYYPQSIITFQFKGVAGVLDGGLRTVQPRAVRFVDAGWSFNHEFKWMLDAWDCDKGGDRSFPLDRISNIKVIRPSETSYDEPLIQELINLHEAITK